MSVQSALDRGRAARLRLMRDTVTVTRVTGRVFNSTTLQYADTTATVYTGDADVKPQAIGDQDVQAVGREVVLRRYDAALPYSVGTVFELDDVLTVTASDDTTLVGRPLTVVGVQYGPRRTAHHLFVEDRS